MTTKGDPEVDVSDDNGTQTESDHENEIHDTGKPSKKLERKRPSEKIESGSNDGETSESDVETKGKIKDNQPFVTLDKPAKTSPQKKDAKIIFFEEKNSAISSLFVSLFQFIIKRDSRRFVVMSYTAYTEIASLTKQNPNDQLIIFLCYPFSDTSDSFSFENTEILCHPTTQYSSTACYQTTMDNAENENFLTVGLNLLSAVGVELNQERLNLVTTFVDNLGINKILTDVYIRDSRDITDFLARIFFSLEGNMDWEYWKTLVAKLEDSTKPSTQCVHLLPAFFIFYTMEKIATDEDFKSICRTKNTRGFQTRTNRYEAIFKRNLHSMHPQTDILKRLPVKYGTSGDGVYLKGVTTIEPALFWERCFGYALSKIYSEESKTNTFMITRNVSAASPANITIDARTIIERTIPAPVQTLKKKAKNP